MNDVHLDRIATSLERLVVLLEGQEASRYACSHPGCTATKSSEWATCPQHRQTNKKPADVFPDQ